MLWKEKVTVYHVICLLRVIMMLFFLNFKIKIYRKRCRICSHSHFRGIWNAAKTQTDVFIPHCLSSALFLCYATGNVFRPTKSHAGQTTTQQESIDRSDQPNTKNLCLSAAVWKPLPAFRERKNGNWSSFLMFCSGQFYVSFRTIKFVTLGEGELQYLKIITVMIGADGRGHYVSCQGLSCSPGGFGALRESGLQWEQAAAACWRALPLTLFIPTAGVTSSPRPTLTHTHIHTCAPHTHAHKHTHAQNHRASCTFTHTLTHTQMSVWCVCEGGPGTTYREQRGKSGKNAASSNKSHHNAEKNPQPHPQKRKKNLVSLFQSSQKCLTKAEIENILDKRIQAPFWKGPHTKLCVIPTRNWFIYQKIIRFNAKALRPQIKDNKWWVHWRGLGRKGRTTLGWKFSLFLCLLFSGSLFTRHTQDFTWGEQLQEQWRWSCAEWPPQNKRKQ